MQTSCLVFKKDALPRRAVIRFVTYPPFEWAMLAVILCNCIALALDSNRPGFNQTSLYRSLQTANLFFLAAFTLEMILKTIAHGLLLGPNTYLRDGAWATGNKGGRWLH